MSAHLDRGGEVFNACVVFLFSVHYYVSLHEYPAKNAEINGLTILQLLFVDIRLCQTIQGRKNMGLRDHPDVKATNLRA